MKKKLGEILLLSGYINQMQLSIALLLQKYLPLQFGDILKYCGWLSASHCREAMAEQYNIDIFDFNKHNLSPTDSFDINNCHMIKYINSIDSNNNQVILILESSINIPLMIELQHTYTKAKILLISNNNFSKFIQLHYEDILLDNAVNLIINNNPLASAKFINYRKIILSTFVSMFLMMKFYVLFFLHSIMNILLSTIQTCFKILLFFSSILSNKKEIDINLDIENLPIYSVLIPLYHEGNKVQNIVENISKLNYPKHKLDVKIIVEEDDRLTRRALALVDLPEYFDVVIVPYALPRTKPKAMNYALPLVRGEYVVIYDAEDAPEPNQLLKALAKFKELPEKYICLQSRLTFYNANENILTKLFSLEYNIWFRHLLHGLDKCKIPLPLGGTSNHFKVEYLRKLYGWDPYNVTEDADLGIRIGINGYMSGMLDSVTYEECLTSLHAWFFQRVRWIKGFMKTYIIYVKNRPNNNIKNDLAIHCFVFLATYNFIIMPWIIGFGLYHYDIFWIKNIFLISLITSTIFNYFSVFWVIYEDYLQNGYIGKYDIIAALLWPFYFILHSIASYISVFELFTEPFKWNKTTHGTSKFKPPNS